MIAPRPFPVGPQLSETDALASVERALERLYPVHDLRLVLSAAPEVKEAVCAAYRAKGYEARPIEHGIYLHHAEDDAEREADLAAYDEQRHAAREREDRRLTRLRAEEGDR